MYNKFALTSGPVILLIMLASLQEFDKNRPDNTQGMIVVGFIALIQLFLLRKKLQPYKEKN